MVRLVSTREVYMQGVQPFVKSHAIIRYAQRVLGREVGYIGALSPLERATITQKIVEVVTVGRVPEAREVLLFVRDNVAHDKEVSRVFRTQSSGTSVDSSWGSYHMHNDVIAILEKEPQQSMAFVRTIIVPDENQLRTLEDMNRPPVKSPPPQPEPPVVDTKWGQPATIEILVVPAAWSPRLVRGARFIQKWVSRIPENRRFYCESVFQESLKEALNERIKVTRVPQRMGKREGFLSSLREWIKNSCTKPLRGSGHVFLVCEEELVRDLLPLLPCEDGVATAFLATPIVPGHIHGLHAKGGTIKRHECIYKPARSTSP